MLVFFEKERKMTKFDFFTSRVNLFVINQTYSLCSSVLTTCSNNLRFLSAYKILVSKDKS